MTLTMRQLDALLTRSADGLLEAVRNTDTDDVAKLVFAAGAWFVCTATAQVARGDPEGRRILEAFANGHLRIEEHFRDIRAARSREAGLCVDE